MIAPKIPTWLLVHDALFLHLSLSTWILMMWLIRSALTGYQSLRFMLWNLFLAWVPYLCSQLLARLSTPSASPSRLALGGLALLWLLFFPNAPYLVTDLLHLRPRNFPLWFDTLLLFAFALAGLLLGMSSLARIHSLLHRRLTRRAAWFSVLALLFLASFGIYLGRIERWNSWNLFDRPFSALSAILEKMVFPWIHLKVWAFTSATFSLLVLCYLFSLSALSPISPSPEAQRDITPS
ncbi:MAG: DUF1361 domain-containing protein [Myxococcales bacterium]|nr:DUF1361 domain-containing protein [Myxococcales bacterium]